MQGRYAGAAAGGSGKCRCCVSAPYLRPLAAEFLPGGANAWAGDLGWHCGTHTVLTDLRVGDPLGSWGCCRSQGAIYLFFFVEVFSSLLFNKVPNIIWCELCFGNELKLSGLLRHNPGADQFVSWKWADVISTSLHINLTLLHPTQPFCSFPPFTAQISWPQTLSCEYKVAGEVPDDVLLPSFRDFNEYFDSCLNIAM